MKFKNLLLAFFVFFIFNACSDDKKVEDSNATINASLSQGEKLNFELKFLNGELLNIKAEAGKLEFRTNNKATLFVFFTTWCAPCLAEIPELNKMQEKYKDKFNIIGILLEDKEQNELDEFLAKYPINYQIANGENNYLFARAVGGINGIPTMFLYTKKGELFNQYLGVIAPEMLDIEISKAVF
ncbi:MULTISPECIES: TlpA family protein disulfide reductase [unclassified Campylobacter]|uniref:TlpA family protein disulfide reductase n=1 Tax=unclassified Campylobacter TaxID=2593542 RepID=UPI001237A228|nr:MULTISPECIES: TlpA disulfide reductase family protein [unclassified Campylobacter]KAA6226678.1 TlpA family protein disulfide reductase [Campylobacter sp. LR286c]KAA6227692.1 TlpA family protein disulfide reductase [Campylobacter sp. LR196d]KAA6227710.1 TlpA family protein disulfide reductase [Campylobacter sp. LR185c]KAA6231241.1 TlpA family protein disulfide reductase [Campylobacter sp. LR291e]KAA6234130.1 TlpA family protein disulfide reductase [Campylobacter sp. LR264d]